MDMTRKEIDREMKRINRTQVDRERRRGLLPRILVAVCAGVLGCVGRGEILPEPNHSHSPTHKHHEFKCLACGFKDTVGVEGYCMGCVENGYLGCSRQEYEESSEDFARVYPDI